MADAPLRDLPRVVAAVALVLGASGALGPGALCDERRLAPSEPDPRLELIETESNMAFRLSSSLDANGDRSRHLISVPFHHGFSDLADATLDDPCATLVGDGVIDAVDVLCDWWTSRQGGMVVSRWDEPSARWQDRHLSRDPVTGEVVLGGDWTEPLRPREAIAVSVSPPEGSSAVSNPIVIVGSHDPTAPGQPVALQPGADKGQVLVNLPYHTMYWHHAELLCGLRGVDWSDGDGDGWPDTCEGGLFDPVTGSRVAVGTFDEDAPPPSGDGFISLSVHRDTSSGELVFEGENAELVPGHAYLVFLEAPHGGATFLSPHF